MIHIEIQQQLLYRLCTHARVKLIAVFFDFLVILFVRQQLPDLQVSHAWVDDHKGLEIQDAFDIAQRHIE